MEKQHLINQNSDLRAKWTGLDAVFPTASDESQEMYKLRYIIPPKSILKKNKRDGRGI
ncbi:hypothetical protein MKX42_18230 [Paenibacillus sp. FSL R7-0204]|uniref:hypothetical protein n=1 Tax=Paenibacillus sp. FSL R7-0204 TaxID=2921675 RepID=UPI0030FC382B